MLLGTFLLVYFVTPWSVHLVVKWLPIEHPERIVNSIAIIATIVVYRLLRSHFGDKVPQV